MLELTWDNSGRQLWECEGWQLVGQGELVDWDDRTNPMTAAIHALACAYLTPEVIAEIIASIAQEECNVIDLGSERKLRGIQSSHSGLASAGTRARSEQNPPDFRSALPAQRPAHD